ncbi:hypothetical protein Ctob_012675 [Chrysochromulina tobinii]|uniref:Dynamin-type G domain-containing protein n=1 Tax=Chrysochromulina tobinii TaxID=1460289 RepID=A0A0M0JRJ5_9EUKA|nr:hypothetical protein Ctob_012675 [Chrysochromulina tobinii]|eukprot:KOO29095.1 hypothetical protein Ctob_012675 [Chrysochromulina sp. CCMP291]
MASWPIVALFATLTIAAAEDATSAPPVSLTKLQSELAQLIDVLPLDGHALEPPTIVLAGHHNDGKSALLEALIGVRLSHVGASMMTRRPLRVHLQHDETCDEPQLYLTRESEAGAPEELVPAAEVRQYVEAENGRLARTGEVDDTEIRVRMRWRNAPNVVILDTPGLLSLQSGTRTVADAALTRYSEEAERVLLAQLTPSVRVCLCLEDTADWQLSPTRRVVGRADPTLERTVLVATKLDGKLAQFSMPEDLHRLLEPPALQAQHPELLGGPIFTSVPPTRDPSPSALAEAEPEEWVSAEEVVNAMGIDGYHDGVNYMRAVCVIVVEKAHGFFATALDNLLRDFTETLMTRRVTEPMIALINELVREIIRAWREEFCRTIAIKLNACFLLPFCDELPNHLRKQVREYARELGVSEKLAEPPAGAKAIAHDERTQRLQESIDETTRRKQRLQQLAARMRAMPRVSAVAKPAGAAAGGGGMQRG